MLVYADTSALLKLYLEEPYSEDMHELCSRGNFAVCRISWAEAMAAFARRVRETVSEDDGLESIRQAFAGNWARHEIVEVTQSVVERAGEFADIFALRGYDAVQLAAAQELSLYLDEPPTFACFDARLNKAARVLGMQVAFLDAR